MQRIEILIPDMPRAEEILPWLRKIEDKKIYTNYGPLNEQLERRLRAMFSTDIDLHLTTVSSATLGIELAIEALNLPPGSKILLPSLSFIATGASIVRSGMVPVFGDVDLNSWLLTPEIATQAINDMDIDAVIPVSTLGVAQDSSAWDKFSETYSIPVIIDAAGGFGNQTMGKRIHVVFSLHATKSLGIGEGGFVVSSCPEYIEKIKVLANFGFGRLPNPRVVREIGTNAKLSEYHAAVAHAALDRWPAQHKKRLALMSIYKEELASLSDELVLQECGLETIRTLLSLRLNDQHETQNVCSDLEQDGITTKTWYCPPIHEHPAFENFLPAGSLANTIKVARQLISLPFHLELTQPDVRQVINSLQNSLLRQASVIG